MEIASVFQLRVRCSRVLRSHNGVDGVEQRLFGRAQQTRRAILDRIDALQQDGSSCRWQVWQALLILTIGLRSQWSEILTAPSRT